MSYYQFTPSQTFQHDFPYTKWEGAFTEEELNKIIEIGLELSMQQATVSGLGNEDGCIRKTKVSWIANRAGTEWIYDRLAYVCRSLNSKFYGFDLFGFSEDMQFTQYESETEDHYTWHQDFSSSSVSPRKVSMVIQLSDPSEYEGGELQVMTSAETCGIEKQKGLIALFPSWTLHRVTPVTSGTRYSLVVWVCGPDFK